MGLRKGERMSFEHRTAIAASRLGITTEEYLAHIHADERWCGRCRQWVPAGVFQTVTAKVSGYCRPCTAAKQRELYQRRKTGGVL